MKRFLFIIFLTSCTYQPPPPGTEWTADEQREQYEQSRRDTWVLTILAIIPAALIASK